MTDEPERCTGCPRTDTTWSPAFAAWYCPACLWHRTEKELANPRTDERTTP
jgi:hypothetical protein